MRGVVGRRVRGRRRMCGWGPICAPAITNFVGGMAAPGCIGSSKAAAFASAGTAWLGLCGCMDCAVSAVDGRGGAMGPQMGTGLTVQALEMALQRRCVVPGLLHHSDRGSQYAAAMYQQRLAARGIACSMIRPGNCWDNAVAESFFATLKSELVYLRRFQTRQEAKNEIFEYLEGFYNRQRRHSTLGYLSPVEFEERTGLVIHRVH